MSSSASSDGDSPSHSFLNALGGDAEGAIKMFQELDMDPKLDCLPPLRLTDEGSVYESIRSENPSEQSLTLQDSTTKLDRQMIQLCGILKRHTLMSEPVLDLVGIICREDEVMRTHPDLLTKFKTIASSQASEAIIRAELRYHANLGYKYFLGNVSGIYMGLVNASGTKHLEQVKMISQILDSQAARDAQQEANSRLLMKELERITTQANNASHVTSQLVAAADKLEMLINELHTHPILPTATTSSTPVRAPSSPNLTVEWIKDDGVYRHGYGSITLRGNSVNIEPHGIEGGTLEKILLSNLKTKAKRELLNCDLELLVSKLDKNPDLISMLNSQDPDVRFEAITDILKSVPRASFQWSQ